MRSIFSTVCLVPIECASRTKGKVKNWANQRNYHQLKHPGCSRDIRTTWCNGCSVYRTVIPWNGFRQLEWVTKYAFRSPSDVCCPPATSGASRSHENPLSNLRRLIPQKPRRAYRQHEFPPFFPSSEASCHCPTRHLSRERRGLP